MKTLSTLRLGALILAISIGRTDASCNVGNPYGTVEMVSQGEGKIDFLHVDPRYEVVNGTFVMPCDGQTHATIFVKSDQERPHANDSLPLAEGNCSIRGHPSFGEHATIGFYATPPFLRSENDEVSKAMKSECSLVENSLYITYNIHKGVIKVDQPDTNRTLQSGQETQFYRSRLSSGHPDKYDRTFSIELEGTGSSAKRTVLAKCGALGVVPFNNRPVIDITAKPPFFEVKGINNTLKTVPDKEVFKIECEEMPVQLPLAEKKKTYPTTRR